MNLPPESMATEIGSAPVDGVYVNSISPSSAPFTMLLTPGMLPLLTSARSAKKAFLGMISDDLSKTQSSMLRKKSGVILSTGCSVGMRNSSTKSYRRSMQVSDDVGPFLLFLWKWEGVVC